jgi:hypothetical protein
VLKLKCSLQFIWMYLERKQKFILIYGVVFGEQTAASSAECRHYCRLQMMSYSSLDSKVCCVWVQNLEFCWMDVRMSVAFNWVQNLGSCVGWMFECR